MWPSETNGSRGKNNQVHYEDSSKENINLQQENWSLSGNTSHCYYLRNAVNKQNRVYFNLGHKNLKIFSIGGSLFFTDFPDKAFQTVVDSQFTNQYTIHRMIKINTVWKGTKYQTKLAGTSCYCYYYCLPAQCPFPMGGWKDNLYIDRSIFRRLPPIVFQELKAQARSSGESGQSSDQRSRIAQDLPTVEVILCEFVGLLD